VGFARVKAFFQTQIRRIGRPGDDGPSSVDEFDSEQR